jgi:hypothetical protein
VPWQATLAVLVLAVLMGMLAWSVRGGLRADVRVEGRDLVITPRGLGKLWSMRGRIRVPLGAVRDVRPEPNAASIPRGLRPPATHFPRVFTAGSYRGDPDRSFWLVGDGLHGLVIDLAAGAPYDRIVVEVDDPHETIAAITQAR